MARTANRTVFKRLSFDEKQFVFDRCETMSDDRISRIIKKPIRYVTHYRYDVLGIRKSRLTRNKKGFTLTEKHDARKELTALEMFNYKGIMQDSVDKRIEFLKSLL